MTYGEYGHLFAISYFSSLPDWNFHKRFSPVNHHTVSSRVTDRKRPRVFQLSREHKIAKFFFIHGCGHNHIGQTSQVCIIKCPVMGRSVSSGKTATVKTENNMQILQGNVMDHLVVTTLHKRRIDIAKGNHSLCGKPRGKSHCMLLCYSNVKSPVRHSFNHDRKRTTGRHGRGYTHNFRIFFS